MQTDRMLKRNSSKARCLFFYIPKKMPRIALTRWERKRNVKIKKKMETEKYDDNETQKRNW